MNIGVAKAIRAGRISFLALAVSSFVPAAMAQTVPDEPGSALAAQLDLPANLQFFGKADPNVRNPPYHLLC